MVVASSFHQLSHRSNLGSIVEAKGQPPPLPGMEKTGEVAALSQFDKNWECGQISSSRCKAIFWVEDGTGKRVSLLFKDRCKGMCNDCIEEVRPTKTLKVRKSYRVWFAAMNLRLKKEEQEEFGEH